jgi:hypothetical protein
MRKEWKKPELEVLDVRMTMSGYPDIEQDFVDKNGTEILTGPGGS